MGRTAARATVCVGWLLSCVGTAAAEPWPTLQASVDRARNQSLGAVAAVADERAARAARAGAGLPPFLNPSVGFSSAPSAIVSGGLDMSVGVTQPVELAGQRSARLQTVERDAAWKAASSRAALADLTGDVVRAWSAAAIARVRLTEAKNGERGADEEVRVVTERLRAGDATRLDESLARAEEARWAQLRAEAELRLDESLLRLSQLLGGADLGVPPDEPLPMPALSKATRVDGSRVAEDSPAVQARKAESMFYASDIRRLEREVWPALGVNVSASRGAVGDYTVSGGLSWAIPAVQRFQGPIAVASERAAGAERMAAVTARVVEARWRGALRLLDESLRGVEELEQVGLPAAQRAVEASEQAYRAGKTDVLRVLVARRDLATVRTRRLDLSERAWNAFADLCALRGELP